MKKVIYLMGLLLLFTLIGCNTTQNVEIKISDKVVIDTQENIYLVDNGNVIDSNLVNWTISNYEMAEINNGILFAKSKGTIVISVFYQGTIYSKEIEIVDPYVEDIIISGESEVIMGKTIKLQATVLPSIITSEVVWSSENEEIATVVNGVVKGHQIGETYILVQCDDFIKKYLISVIEYPTKLEIKAVDKIIIGEIITLEYNIDDEVILRSKDRNIIETFDNNIVGINAGVTTIEAIVKDRPNIVSTITIEVINEKKTMTATAEEQQQIKEILNKMTINQLVGELFNIRFSKEAWGWYSEVAFNSTTGLPDAEFGTVLSQTNVVDYISNYPFGNYTLFTDETKDRTQLQKAINTLTQMGKEKTGVNPFICINYSGGYINGLNGYPYNSTIGSSFSISLSYKLSNTLGKEFRAMGINMVMDDFASANDQYNFSNGLSITLFHGNNIRRGYEANNIAYATGATFSNEVDVDNYYKKQMIQYACNSGYEMIDVPLCYVVDTHIPIEIDFEYIKTIRNEYKYDGVAMLDFNSTDILESSSQFIEAINSGYDMINYDMMFLNASWRDMEDYYNYYKTLAERVFGIYDDMVQAVENGVISNERLNEAVSRILLVKLRNNIINDEEYSANYNEIGEELARMNASYIRFEGTMYRIDRTRSTLIIADNLKGQEDNTLGYLLTQHFKKTGNNNVIVYSFNTLSFSTIYTTAAQCQDIFIYVRDMKVGKEIQSTFVAEFVQEISRNNPNICIIFNGGVRQKEFFSYVDNFIYLENYYDNKFQNLINMLDGEITSK